MKITSKKVTGDKMTFKLEAETGYANALRRYTMGNVPTLAIEDVELKKNEGILYDEMVAHRLGLVPLKTDLKSYTYTEGTGKKGISSSVTLTLSAKGPCTVYAKDLKAKDPQVVPVHEDIPILKLLKDQELELQATAEMGIGKTHAKWSPGLVFYKEAGKAFDFTVESWGQLTPEVMVSTATEAFAADLKKFEESIIKKL